MLDVRHLAHRLAIVAFATGTHLLSVDYSHRLAPAFIRTRLDAKKSQRRSKYILD